MGAAMTSPADLARSAVKHHASLTGVKPNSANAITDLLVNLFHLIDRDMEQPVSDFLYVALNEYRGQP
jgi:hypothetical protein